MLDRISLLGLDLKTVSIQIGRNHAYLQQYINRGIPRELGEKVRPLLADALGVSEVELGGRSKSGPSLEPVKDVALVPMYDVQAAAGIGTVIGHEHKIGSWPFPKSYLRQVIAVNHNNLAMIRVIGDSMEPTLHADDWIMVDQNDKGVEVPGIFALHTNDGLVVKRVEKVIGSRPSLITLISDNDRHGRQSVPAETVNVAGRVLWFGRKL